ncbi:LysR family transcriptional regulator [Burkholderia cenocepacia]|uniref:LysR family transcriptional regulator n=1 Tax=Burkholderia cenocepacia TaxID=95486 RepID=UPI000F58653C|nr:LysR family transcriptional regulator [Burkholderia cenocepacia]RQU32757.1 LysR family transcriptional regulator [Burkholderia cenocepacia]RQU56970.1 LysR family transcriptional regulator [Burkholderia cenocepacia]
MNRASHLSVKQLRIFDALMKDGNLSRVAGQIGLTQQAVSANLSSLRDVFGDPLFLRTGRGVMPTSLALELAAEVRDILQAMERLVDRKPFDPANVTATVAISAADYAHSVVVAPELHAIRERAPQLKLILSEFEIDTVAARMSAGETDIVVSIPEYVPENYPRKVLYHERYVCVAASGSTLATQVLSLEKLAKQPHVVVSPARPNLIGSADHWLEQLGLERTVVLSVPHFLLVPKVIKAMEAVAFLPSRLLPDPRLAPLRLERDVEPPGFDLIAAWHPRSATNPLVQWLVEMLTK